MPAECYSRDFKQTSCSEGEIAENTQSKDMSDKICTKKFDSWISFSGSLHVNFVCKMDHFLKNSQNSQIMDFILFLWDGEKFIVVLKVSYVSQLSKSNIRQI